METLPLQNIIAPPASAAAAGAPAVAANDDAAGNPNLPAARRFGALLAFQLGAAMQGAGATTTADDELATLDPATETTPTAAFDPLAGILLPALLPAATPAALPAAAAAASTLAGTGNGVNPGIAARNAATPGNANATGATTAALAADAKAMPRTADNAGTAGNAAAGFATAIAGQTQKQTGDAAALQALTRVGEQVAAKSEVQAPAAPPAFVAQLTAAPATPVASPAQAALQSPVGTTEWNAELGQKIVWMVGDRKQVAELSINPPELGPLDIKLTLDGGQTSAVFSSAHGAVREAVEAALPRLREVLADSGIMLGNASVTADTPRDGRAFADQRAGSGHRNPAQQETDNAISGSTAPLRVVNAPRGMVDLFA